MLAVDHIEIVMSIPDRNFVADRTDGERAMTFDHERLDVYQRALDALDLCDAITAQMPAGRAHLKDQLDRAATSVVLDVAEGAREFSPDEKSRFYRIARRSATETAAILHIVARRGHAAEELTRKAGDPRPRRFDAGQDDEAGHGLGHGLARSARWHGSRLLRTASGVSQQPASEDCRAERCERAPPLALPANGLDRTRDHGVRGGRQSAIAAVPSSPTSSVSCPR